MSPTTKRKTAQKADKQPRVKWLFPRKTLEDALKIPLLLKEKNGGNPWAPEEIRKGIGAGSGGNEYFYLTAAARDYGLTTGTNYSGQIGLTDLGRSIVYAPNPEMEKLNKIKAFQNIEVFKAVLEYYKGSNLPEMKYLGNTLESIFKLQKETHEEFSRIFRENCQYLGISSGFTTLSPKENNDKAHQDESSITIAETGKKNGPVAFVILPFIEREPNHQAGFFSEVLRSLITPAAQKCEFIVKTARRQGSDVIQSTIINDLLNAELVIADLTEHNPNVLFELGVRMAIDKPVVLIKATGTKQLFDVDNMLRVFEYSSNLWQTTIEKDLPNLIEFIRGAWENKDSNQSYMKLLRTKPA